MFVAKNTANLFAIVWIALFVLRDLLINSFCHIINPVTSSINSDAKKLK